MVLKRRALFLGLALATLLFMASLPVQAALGEPVDSMTPDEKQLSAVRRHLTVHNGYTIHEVSSEAVVVRQYVSPSGVVFGIAWNGLIHPDLMPLLGAYASEYEEARKQTPRKHDRRHLRVQANRVVVETWGHMRNLQGRAYDPDLIPAGVSRDEIK